MNLPESRPSKKQRGKSILAAHPTIRNRTRPFERKKGIGGNDGNTIINAFEEYGPEK
jgi:hypothetical protein